MNYYIMRPLINEEGATFGYDVARVPEGANVEHIIKMCEASGAENVRWNIISTETYNQITDPSLQRDVWDQLRLVDMRLDPELMDKVERRKDREVWSEWCSLTLSSMVADWYME